PTDKTIVVRRLQELGEVVAVTGEGPVLNIADVGFPMGITGTEVAKEASAIVLMDDNFSGILNSLMRGRAVNDSVRKFLQFRLAVTLSTVVLLFISAIDSGDNKSALFGDVIFWAISVMYTLAIHAFATEPPSFRLPTSKTAPLINFNMYGAKLFHLESPDGTITPEHLLTLHTMIFNKFVFLQVFNELNCRRIDECD
ncbi:hypothetical protein BGZ58_005560, partial [Dissophora ornata]